MNKLLLAGLVAGVAFAGVAQAEDGEALAKKSGCSTCHAMAKKTVGPAIKDIAAKYAGQADAAAKLEAKVLNGGSGSFGSMPMPAQKNLSAENAKALVSWMLSVK